MAHPSYLATPIGLLIALFGPALLFTRLADLLGPRERLATRVRELLVLWVLAAAVLAIVVCWERLPMSSIGLRFELRSVVGGLMLAAILIYVVAPLLYRLLALLPARGFERGLAELTHLPRWFLLFAALTGGVAEEILYRGYAIERLAALTGSIGAAALIATSVFALMHLPMWGWGPVATFFLSGGFLAVVFVWSQDLLACIIAHVAADAVGFLSAHRDRRGEPQHP